MDASSISKIFSALADQTTLRENSSTSQLSNGVRLYQSQRYNEAASAFKMAIAYKPDYLDAHNFLAATYLKMGKTNEAIEAYKLSLRIDNSQDETHINLANVYIDNKRYNDAEKELQTASRLNPRYSLAPYTLGHMYMQTDRAQEALTQFKKVVALEPKNGNAHYGMGIAYNKLGMFDEAVKELTEATRLKKDFALATFELGNAYLGLGNKDMAQEQVNALNKMESSQGYELATDLSASIEQPKMFSFNSSGSSFIPNMFAGTPLLALDAQLINPNEAKEFTMQFQFDSEMDVSSVTNIANWSIRKADGGTAGIYNNGLHTSTDTAVPSMPSFVTYDRDNQTATVRFVLAQNADGNATIDPSHLVFKFSGKDVNGKTMDPTADEYDGFSGTPF